MQFCLCVCACCFIALVYNEHIKKETISEGAGAHEQGPSASDG